MHTWNTSFCTLFWGWVGKICCKIKMFQNTSMHGSTRTCFSYIAGANPCVPIRCAHGSGSRRAMCRSDKPHRDTWGLYLGLYSPYPEVTSSQLLFSVGYSTGHAACMCQRMLGLDCLLIYCWCQICWILMSLSNK